MNYFKIEDGKLICKQNGETIQIEAWGENSLRIRSRKMGPILDADFALLSVEDKQTKITIEEKIAWIENGKLRAEVNLDNWGNKVNIRFYNEKGELLLKEIDRGGALARESRKFKPIIGGDYQLSVTFESNPREKIFGMGQYQMERMNLKGCSLELAHRNSQASIPFYISDLGYGFFWHNPAIGKVYFGLNETEWLAESSKQLDYWITAGDTPAEIEEAYATVTGKVPMMPEYGLGFWQCKLRYATQEELLQVAREYKSRNLPIDVIVIDFFHWPEMGDFRFNEEFFPDPKAMVEELRDMGIELMVSIWPQIALNSENYQEMNQKGLLVRSEYGVEVQMQFGGDSVFFDATNPEAREYVWDKCRQNYYDYGIKVFWLDEAEPEYKTYDFSNYRYYDGPNVQIGNVYPQKFSRTFYDGQTQAGQENIINLVRCAWAGSQRYGALVWSGDIHSSYTDFRKQICAGLHMGLAGIPWWTTDIGGFGGGNPDDPHFRDLLVRWFQYGTFCPVMRLHGDRSPQRELFSKKTGRKEMHTGAANEVWSFGEEVYEILTKFMSIRELMRDYTRVLMKEAHEVGSPVIRTVFYEFPMDKATWDISDQFMYGNDILVAPIVELYATKRKVYLPDGTKWVDARDGKEYEGGKSYLVEAPIDTLPIFLKEGNQAYLIGKL
ncbi:MAG TPA: TIM-barrel domain-containing protein [Niallia sp.]|nr:TIM-barrel domain-containing protein [Niallia sp.]